MAEVVIEIHTYRTYILAHTLYTYGYTYTRTSIHVCTYKRARERQTNKQEGIYQGNEKEKFSESESAR